MNDTHNHAPPMMMKIKTIIVSRVEVDGKPGYRVESVSNSIEYYPPQFLSVSEVEKLCEDNSWQVNVVSPRGIPVP